MKKLSLIIAALLTAVQLYAVNFYTINGVEYMIDDLSRSATLCYFSDNVSGDVVVPDTITVDNVKYPVKALGDGQHQLSPKITSIAIPSTVTALNSYCFSGCELLKEITIPSSVKKLGNYCFQKCSSLSAVHLPNSITTLSQGCFQECKSLKELIIPESIDSIKTYCFRYCTNLKSIRIPSSVTHIGSYCFSQCSKLDTMSYAYPSQVKYFGNHCFEGCDKLKEVIFPASTKYVGTLCLPNSSQLARVYCYAIVPPECGGYGILFQKHQTILYVPEGCVDIYKNTDWWNEFIEIRPIDEQDATGINTAKAQHTNAKATSTNGILMLSGLSAGELVSFYAYDGKCIGKAVATDDGTVRFYSGKETIVIAKVRNRSFKIKAQ